MNRFQICHFDIQNIKGNGEEQARISPVNELWESYSMKFVYFLSRAVTSWWTSA
jgi:hypothetical protein